MHIFINPGFLYVYSKGCLLDAYPHFLHQEASIHILGDSFSKLVGEGQLIVMNVGFKTIIADFVGEMLFQFTE